ncbi:MAG: tetratricopeptide (TPR) repeat protein, partial [Candidatus Paceibacteria bacterium]
MFARILLCGLLSGAALLPAPDDSLETATQLLQKKSYVEASALLEDLLLRDALNPALHEQMGLALLGLGAAGRAAQRFDIALELLGDGGDPNQVKRVTRSLQRADPLEKRRSKLRRDATSGLYKASKKLFELGNTERALAAITGLERLAEGKDAPNLVALLEEILASSREVNLDEETQERKEGESWPLLTYKSEHYILEANLEREVVELVAATMDDIHGYYVDL